MPKAKVEAEIYAEKERVARGLVANPNSVLVNDEQSSVASKADEKAPAQAHTEALVS